LSWLSPSVGAGLPPAPLVSGPKIELRDLLAENICILVSSLKKAPIWVLRLKIYKKSGI
jgi:hypothetical protein